MKKLQLTFIAIVLVATSIFAQTPEAFKYQAVARDNAGLVIANQAIGFKLSILQGSGTGTAVYSEKYTLTTNSYGIVTLEVGNGTVLTGDFSIIDWGADTYFVEVAMDITGGASYTTMGSTQFLSVPYALHAKTADNAFSGDYSDLTGTPTNVSEFTNDAAYITSEVDASATNELQDISIIGHDISITDGSTITIPDNVDDADIDPANEIQDISIVGDQLTISGANTITLPDNVDDADASITNEIQDISIVGDQLTISNGSTITLPDNVDDADVDPANEIQDISIVGDQLTISDGSTVTIPDNVNDADASVTNELQSLSIVGHDITLTDGGMITIPDNVNDADIDPANEIQNLSQVLSQGTDAGNNAIVNISQGGIGTATPHASAILEVSSTTKGFLPTRLTTTQINNITSPAEGLIVYNTTTNNMMYFDGTVWKNFSL